MNKINEHQIAKTLTARPFLHEIGPFTAADTNSGELIIMCLGF